MNAKNVLQKAYELLSDPARWTQEAYARDIHQFNNTHTHDEILEAIRVAITSAE